MSYYVHELTTLARKLREKHPDDAICLMMAAKHIVLCERALRMTLPQIDKRDHKTLTAFRLAGVVDKHQRKATQ